MTNAEVRQFLIDLIADQLSVVSDEDFEQLNRKKYKEPVLKLTIFPHLLKVNHKELDNLQALAVLKKMKSEGLIIDCGFVSKFEKPNKITKDLPATYWLGVVLVLTKRQVELFGKPVRVNFDANSGYLEYQGNKVKFSISSKQYTLLKALFLKQGQLVSLKKLAEEIWPNSSDVGVAVKNNLYDTVRKIKAKLKKAGVTESIFLETNDGYGVK